MPSVATFYETFAALGCEPSHVALFRRTRELRDKLLSQHLVYVGGSCCPHYDGEAERRPAYQRLMLDGAVAAGYAVDDHAALHFRDGDLLRVVAGNSTSKAYRVACRAAGGGQQDIDEVVLSAQVLNDEGRPNVGG